MCPIRELLAFVVGPICSKNYFGSSKYCFVSPKRMPITVSPKRMLIIGLDSAETFLWPLAQLRSRSTVYGFGPIGNGCNWWLCESCWNKPQKAPDDEEKEDNVKAVIDAVKGFKFEADVS